MKQKPTHLSVMKKILVPTDFSTQANNALYAASQIARKGDIELILLHIIELPQQAVDEVNVGAEIPEVIFFKKSAQNRLTRLALSPVLDGIKISTVLKLDRTFLGVTQVAEANEVDLIVMGSHGASGVKEMLIGSNTEKVVRTSKTPVLVIKDDAQNFKIDNFVFASDFSDGMKDPFLKAIKFSKIFGSKLHLLMVNTPNNFKPTHIAEEIVDHFLAEVDKKDYNFHIYNDLNVEKGILNFSRSVNADVIGLSTHGRKGISHFFNGSIGEDLVNHSSISVITFKI